MAKDSARSTGRTELDVSSALAEVSTALIRSASLDEMANVVLESAIRLTGSQFGGVGYVDPATGYLVSPTLTRDAWDQCQLPGNDFVLKEFRGLWGWVLENHRPVLVNDVADDPRSTGLPQGHLPIYRFLSVPALVGEELFGQIALANSGRDYTRQDQTLVEHLASVYAVAVQKKRAEEALESSEERFRSVVQSASDAIITLDKQGDIISWNAAAEAMFGYSADQALGAPLVLIVPERFHEAHRQGLERLVATGKPRLIGKSIEMIGLRRDGHEFPIEMCLSTWKARDGLFFTGIVHDITERKRAEESLRRSHDELDSRVQERTAALFRTNELLLAQIDERMRVEKDLRSSEERFRQLAENIDQVFWMFEPGSRQILYVSPAYERVWGRSRQSLYERPESLLETIHPEDREHVADLLRWSQEGCDEEYRILRPDGTVLWIRMRAFPIRNRAGEVYRITGIAEDISEQRRSQAALFQAERLSIAGKLVASLAHEINNPLQSAIGCLDLAREVTAEGEESLPFLQVASDALQRASNVVQEMRTLHRQSSAEEKKLADPNALIEKVLLLTKKQCELYDIQVIWQPGDELPPLRLMPDAMQQVFLNLVLNAIDAMPQGGTLEVSTSGTARPAGLSIRFSDSGIGIPPEALNLIFDPFYSLKSEGLGLGLFISQNIVQQHEGRIDVASRLGEGATFHIWLPALSRSE